jgi:hypothetical protein
MPPRAATSTSVVAAWPSTTRALVYAFLLLYLLVAWYMLSTLSITPSAAPELSSKCAKHAVSSSVIASGSAVGDHSSAIPFNFHKILHIADVDGHETMRDDEMFAEEHLSKHVEMRQVVEQAWRYLETTHPELEIDQVTRTDRVFDRLFGTVYTIELVCGVVIF